MAPPQDDVKTLIALRDSLNASIDAYVALTPEQKLQKPLVNKSRQQIWTTANKIAAETVNPAQGATQLAFMVSTLKLSSENMFSIIDIAAVAMAECSCAHCVGAGYLQSAWRVNDCGRAGKEDWGRGDPDRCVLPEMRW